MTNTTNTPHLTASQIALIESGLTGAEAEAAAHEQIWMLNTEPGWRPSDAMRRACQRVEKGTVSSPVARRVLGLF